MKFSFSQSSTIRFQKISRVKILSGLRWLGKFSIWTLFLGTVLWLSYIWYVSVYAYHWTEEQKVRYQSEYAGETSFREEQFNATIDLVKERIRLHQTRPEVQKDIFTGDPIQEDGE